MAVTVNERTWPEYLLELWAACDWHKASGERGERERIRAHLFGEWCERLLVLSGVPEETRLPLVDLARLSFAEIDSRELGERHPLKAGYSAGAHTPEDFAIHLADKKTDSQALSGLVKFARSLAAVEFAPLQNGLPPLWQRVHLSFDGRIRLSPVSGPGDDGAAGEISALVSSTKNRIGFEPDILAGLKNAPPGDVVILSHFDPHGIISLAPTVRTLVENGFTYKIVSGYETTGDYGRLWKNIIQRLYADDATSAIILLDLSIDSRHPERSREFAARANAGRKPVIWIDHHRDTLMDAKNLAGDLVSLRLTGVLGTNLADRITNEEVPFLAAGALSDKDTYGLWAAEQWQKGGRLTNLGDLLSGIEKSLDLITPPHKSLRKQLKAAEADPFANMRSKIVKCDAEYAANLGRICKKRPLTLSDIAPIPSDELAQIPEVVEAWNSPGAMGQALALDSLAGKWEVQGRMVVFTVRPSTAGRFWYDFLEAAMDECGMDAEGRPVSPYAVAYRIIDGGGANLLFTTHHRAIHAPDVRLFLPKAFQDKWIGHSRAFWLDVETGSEEKLIAAVAKKITKFMNEVFPV